MKVEPVFDKKVDNSVLYPNPTPATPEQRMARENLMLYCVTGSHMYGTSTPESDTDHAGIFLPNPDYVVGLKRCEQVEFKTNSSSSGKRNSSEDKDETIYSLPRYLHLVSQCNPNVMELLWSQNPNLSFPPFFEPFGKELVANRRRFLSQYSRERFTRYAFSQRRKLITKKDRLDAIRETKRIVKINLFGCEGDVLSGRVEITGKTGTVYHAFESGTLKSSAMKKLEEMEDEYGERIKDIDMYGYDLKFGAHVIRLLREGIDILEGKELTFPLPYAQELRDIRLGRMPLEELLRYSESLMKKAETMDSKLPERCDMEWVNDFQVRMLTTFWEQQ